MLHLYAAHRNACVRVSTTIMFVRPFPYELATPPGFQPTTSRKGSLYTLYTLLLIL